MQTNDSLTLLREALAGETANFVEAFPRIFFALQTFHALRFGFPYGFGHRNSPKRKTHRQQFLLAVG